MKSEVAQAAKLIQSALKVAFPGMRFSVRSKSYSGGNSVTVSWTNGPAVEAVEAIANKFEAGTFDGMTDMYNYNHDRKGPCAKFVFTSRTIDDSLSARVLADLKAKFSDKTPEGELMNIRYRILRNSDLCGGYAGIRSVDGFPGFAVIPAALASEVR